MSTVTETILTADQFRLLPDDGVPRELIRGKVVAMNVPTPRHGILCGNVVWELSNFVRPRGLGRVLSNDSGVVTENNPDTVRGPDVSYYSYKRLPKGPVPNGYLSVVPELAVEVRSRTDRLSRAYRKAIEYLDAGVDIVLLLDEQTETLTVYRQEDIQRVLTAEEDLVLPELFGPEFRIPVSRFFAE